MTHMSRQGGLQLAGPGWPDRRRQHPVPLHVRPPADRRRSSGFRGRRGQPRAVGSLCAPPLASAVGPAWERPGLHVRAAVTSSSSGGLGGDELAAEGAEQGGGAAMEGRLAAQGAPAVGERGFLLSR